MLSYEGVMDQFEELHIFKDCFCQRALRKHLPRGFVLSKSYRFRVLLIIQGDKDIDISRDFKLKKDKNTYAICQNDNIQNKSKNK